MEQVPTLSCINYREPLLWVVIMPLSLLALLFGFRLSPWTAGARIFRWPLRVLGVLLITAAGIVLGILGLGSLALLLSGGQDRFCTHYIRPAFLLPGLFAVIGVSWSSARSAPTHPTPNAS